MNRFENDDYPQYKILLLGESFVGKTSIIKNLKGEAFQFSLMVTIGVEYFSKNFSVGRNIVKLQIWDTAGQERFRSLTPQHYRGCKALIFVYDVTNFDTFRNLQTYWLNNVYQHTAEDQKICTFLVGNKADSPARQVTYEMGKAFKESQNFLGFFETSALNGQNVKELFQFVADVTHQHYRVANPGEEEDQAVGDGPLRGSGQDLMTFLTGVRCKKCRRKMLKAVLRKNQIQDGRNSIKLTPGNCDLLAATRLELAKESTCCGGSK